MKKLILSVLVLGIFLFAISGMISAVSYSDTLELCQKDTSDWQCVDEGASATLDYNNLGQEFEFSLDADQTFEEDYVLIYYADQPDRFEDWGGAPAYELGILSAGNTSLSGSVDSGSLPFDYDWNADPNPDYCVSHNGYDDYEHCSGAKIWLIPASDYDGEGEVLNAWNPDNYLFETDLITYFEGECVPEDTQPCGTDLCEGTQTCQEDGTWGDCDSAGESCGTGCIQSGCGGILNFLYGVPTTKDRYYLLQGGSMTCNSEGACISTCTYNSGVCADWDNEDIFPWASCFATCDQPGDCSDTDCDYLDGCYDGKKRDCANVSNDCNLNGNCACENNDCPNPETCEPTGTNIDQDSYDLECGDCNDNDASIYPGATETCNNLDDDCDQQVDENLFQQTTCGVGICAGNQGEETCSAGQWIGDTCNPFAGASYETCNNLDDDCDGSIDEDLFQQTTCGVGVCAGNTGQETCSEGSWIDDTCNEFEGASYETCNNLDDDCDGSIDENLNQPTFNQNGLCEYNTETCSAGSWFEDEGNYIPVPEICDGLDNDCDGLVDEDFVDLGDSCSVGIGECLANGVKVCTANHSGTECSATAGEPSEETCDNLDNDCDGSIDENLNQPTFNQDGLCKYNNETCSAGEWFPDQGNYIPQLEICDGLDNNCDGYIDQGEGLQCVAIDLIPGWNLISIPLVPEDTSIDSVFSTIYDEIADDGEDVAVVLRYDAVADKWYKTRKDFPGFYWASSSSELTDIIPGYGYYIKMADEATIYFNGDLSYILDGDTDTDPVFGMPPSVTLAMDRWNLIGVYGLGNPPISDALVSLEDEEGNEYYDIIYDENGHPPFFSKLTSKEGYWLSLKKSFEGDQTIQYKANYGIDWCHIPWWPHFCD